MTVATTRKLGVILVASSSVTHRTANNRRLPVGSGKVDPQGSDAVTSDHPTERNLFCFVGDLGACRSDYNTTSAGLSVARHKLCSETPPARPDDGMTFI